MPAWCGTRPVWTEARNEVEAIAAAVRAGTVTESAASDGAVRRAFWELRNLVDAARAVIAAAAHREESRGAHYRADFPAPNPALDGQHTLLRSDGPPRYGKLDRVGVGSRKSEIVGFRPTRRLRNRPPAGCGALRPPGAGLRCPGIGGRPRRSGYRRPRRALSTRAGRPHRWRSRALPLFHGP